MDRKKYLQLYLKVEKLTGKDLALELGYGKKQVSNWLTGYRDISDYAMNHMILLRKYKKYKRIKAMRIKLHQKRINNS